MKQLSKSHPVRRPQVAIVALLLIIVLQGVIDLNVRHQLGKKATDNTITQLIIASVDNLYKPAAIDAKTGTVYLPEAHLSLPAIQDPGNQLLYSYNTIDSNDPELAVTSNRLVHQGEAKLLTASTTKPHQSDDQKLADMFAQVPNLEACARGVQFYIRSQNVSGSLQAAFDLHLKDGRTLYGYSDTTCHEDMSGLQTELRHAQSY